jgi:hypothetical protein
MKKLGLAAVLITGAVVAVMVGSAFAVGVNLVPARADVTGSGKVDFSASDADTYTIKIELSGARPNFRYDIWLNMDGTGFAQRVGPSIDIVTDQNGNARRDNLRTTHTKQAGCGVDGCRDSHTLSLLLEEDPLNDNFAPLEQAKIAFVQSPASVTVEGRH